MRPGNSPRHHVRAASFPSGGGPFARTLRALVVAAGVSAGCGRSDGLIPVQGTVRLDGQVLEAAHVVFHPEPGVRGNGGSGVTDSTGRFTLVSPQGRKGVHAGEYRVTVSCRRVSEEARRQAEQALARGLTPAVAAGDAREVVPDAFTAWERTTLRQSVGTDTHNVDIVMTTAAETDRKRTK